jgi:hypothetical protein
MTLSVRDAGAWKNCSAVYVRDAGTWKTVQQAYVCDAGTWKPFHTSTGTIVPWSSGQVTQGGYNSAVFALNASGSRSTLDAESGAQFWIAPQVGMNNFEVFAQFISGTLDGSSSPTGIWMSLATDRLWVANRSSASGPGITQAVVRITIRRAADLAVMAGPTDITLRSTN